LQSHTSLACDYNLHALFAQEYRAGPAVCKMLRPSALSVKGAVGFSDLLIVSVTAGSTVGLGIGIEGVGRKRFGSTTHPRKWLRVNEAGKLNYITVSLSL